MAQKDRFYSPTADEPYDTHATVPEGVLASAQWVVCSVIQRSAVIRGERYDGVLPQPCKEPPPISAFSNVCPEPVLTNGSCFLA